MLRLLCLLLKKSLTTRFSLDNALCLAKTPSRLHSKDLRRLCSKVLPAVRMPVLLAGKEFGKACLFDDGVGSKTLVVIKFHLALENLALRQQLAVLERSGKRP